jgi:hypothetical protein
MMNWKGFGRKRWWLNLKVLFRYVPGGAKKNHEKPQSGYPVSGPRFEPVNSQIRSRSVNNSTTTFGSTVYKITRVSVL